MSRAKEYEKVRDRNDPLERYTITTRLLCEIVKAQGTNPHIAQTHNVGERIVELIKAITWR